MTAIVYMKELKTKEEIDRQIAGKIVKEVRYIEGYSNIDIIFTDGFEISINAEDCFNFMVEIENKIKEI